MDYNRIINISIRIFYRVGSMTSNTKSSLEHEGERLAKLFIHQCHVPQRLSNHILSFHDLSFEQKNRFLSFIAGYLQGVNDRVKWT